MKITAIFSDIDTINYQAPWLLHVTEKVRTQDNYYTTNNLASGDLAKILMDILAVQYPQGLVTGKGKPLQFVPQSVLDEVNSHSSDEPVAYETLIADTGQIPTRDNVHDLFNAWVWLTFPKSKALLNRYQAEQIGNLGVSSSRGRVRDAITVLDENGAILVTCNPSIAKALKGFDWSNCLINPRECWQDPFATDRQHTESTQTMVMLYGHALMEQLIHPRKPLCSHTFIVIVEPEFFALPMQQQVAKVDELLVNELGQWLHQEDVSPRQLSPLPVLGIPNFWQENSNIEFYDDNYVFRNGRRKTKK